jgi:sterol desaturase/sphingolipid hydroxylase (fatty acid hydroxylase superfamily)
MELLAYPLLLLVFVFLFCSEVIAPASKSSCNLRWLFLAMAINMLQLGCSLAAGYFFKDWFSEYSLFRMPPAVPAALVGLLSFLVTSFIFYWWHRALHASSFLWRIHQLHHSPRRIEALSAFYAHPVDSTLANLITCFSSYILFGASPAAAAWVVLYVGLFNFYIHADKTSPYWLGYIVQRPEMHRVHHQYGHHADNYGIPLWDLLFGTWSNPTEKIEQCGFDEPLEKKIFDMLKGRNVHT